jgi:hypothetical protein
MISAQPRDEAARPFKSPGDPGDKKKMLRAAAFGTLAAAFALSGCGGSNSSCPPFTRIVAGDFSRTADRLSWTLEVAEIPAALTFNQADVPAFIQEYSWAVDLDSDRDGQTDLSVAITHYRDSGAAEITTNDILSVTSEDLWTVSGPVSSTSGSIDATISGNTFRLEVDVAEDPGLALVTERGQSTWTTFHQFGSNLGDQCEDRLR